MRMGKRKGKTGTSLWAKGRRTTITTFQMALRAMDWWRIVVAVVRVTG